MTAPTVLILASGRGERFLASGGTTHKLDALLPSRGGSPAKTVLQTTVDAVVATGLPYHIERQAHAGMGDSIAAAVAKTADAEGWLVLPADMPLIDPNAILAVAQALQEATTRETDDAIILPMIHGQRGHPVGFPKACLADLLNLRGDEGARALLQKFKTKKIHVDESPSVTFPEGCLIDMDTAQDLEKINKLLS
jgi:molybdenum cofactor cytidylyltransferase